MRFGRLFFACPLPLATLVASSLAAAEAPSAPLPPLPTSSATSAPSAPPSAPPTAPTANVSPDSVVAPPLDEPAWHAQYAAASDKLNAHDYEEALRLFTALAASAPSDADRALALGQAHVARDMMNGTAPTAPPSAPVTAPPPPEPQEGLVPLSSVRAAKPLATRSADELVFLYLTAAAYGGVSGFLFDAAAYEASHRSSNFNHLGYALAGVTVGGLGMGAVALADSKHALRYGLGQSITSGMYIGLWQGLSWALWDKQRRNYPDTPGYLLTSATIWGFTTAGAIGGGVVGASFHVTPGQASWVATMSIWPALIAGAAAEAITGAPDTSSAIVHGERNMGITSGIVGLVGMGVGIATAAFVQPSIARPRFIDLCGFGAGLTGTVVGAAIKHGYESNEPAVFGGLAIGAALGFGACTVATHWLKGDPVGPHFGKVVEYVQPTITPVPSGMVMGLGGTL